MDDASVEVVGRAGTGFSPSGGCPGVAILSNGNPVPLSATFPKHINQEEAEGFRLLEGEVRTDFLSRLVDCEDGQTYGNACEARAAHVAVAQPGECQQVCGGIAGVPCPDGELCDLPAGMCQAADLQGVCVEKPEVCPEIFEPVCGCDGENYSNDCFRLMAGAQKNHDGECESASNTR